MKIFKWEDYKFKFFNLTLFKICSKKNGINFYIFFIPIFRLRNKVDILYKEIKENSDFDMRKFDEKISTLFPINKKSRNDLSLNKIIYIATELYDSGGHSKCLLNQIKSLSNDYKQYLFLTHRTSTYNCAPMAMNTIEKHSKIIGFDVNRLFYEKQVIEIYNKILECGAKTIFVYIHQDDIFSAAVLSLIKRNTDINIIFFNHASHFPCIGMTFADLILEGMPSTQKITNKRRHLYNCKVIGLQSKAENETIYSTKDEIQEFRKKHGVKNNELLTISGGATYKFFNGNKSEYFEMIKDLLEARKNLKHIVMTRLQPQDAKTIDNIFKNSKEKSRLILLPLSTEYEKYFQAADLYIDSFPVSSALTQIDLTRLKVATVVKINKEKPEYSFHEYMPPNYQYMYENVEDMKQGILNLVDNPCERQNIIKSNYEFWLKTYEANCVKQKFVEIINSFENEVKLINFVNVPYELQLETRNWRNSKHVTIFFRIPYIEEETHKKWLESLKQKEPKNIAFIIEYNNKPIGVTYFHSINYENSTCDWGIYIYEENYRGKKIGDKVLKKCINYAKELEIKNIYLDVLKTNSGAKKLYENNGFKILTKDTSDFLRYKKEL